MVKTAVSLILPDAAFLFEQKLNQQAIPIYLLKIIAQADYQEDATGLERIMYRAFSKNPVEGTDLPSAKLESKKDNAIKVTPCYLHADRDKLILFHRQLSLSAADKKMVFQEIRPLLSDIGSLDDQGYLYLKQQHDIDFTALETVAGKAIDNYLPQGRERRQWLTLANEIQMQLHAAAFNTDRLAQQQLPINSVWFWGAGDYQAKFQPWLRVAGKSKILSDLARLSEVEFESQLTIPPNWPEGRYLYLLDELNSDEVDWQNRLDGLDRRFFESLWQQLRKRKIAKLTLIVPYHGQYHLNAKKRWWLW